MNFIILISSCIVFGWEFSLKKLQNSSWLKFQSRELWIFNGILLAIQRWKSSYLGNPFLDTEEDCKGYYTFQKKDRGVLGFLRKRVDGSVVEIFDEVRLNIISEDVLIFLGYQDGYGGFVGFGTVIKAPSILEGNTGGKFSTESIESSTIIAK